MNCRKRRRAVRLSLLMKIEELKPELCDDCTLNSQVNNSQCGCDAAVAIRKLGIELMKATPPKNASLKYRECIEVDAYLDLKHKGMRDIEIARLYEIGYSTLAKWKTDNGISSAKIKMGVV